MQHEQPFERCDASLGMITEELERQDVDRFPHIERVIIRECIGRGAFGSDQGRDCQC